MSKPIRYYVDTNIPVVGDIERKYGSKLEEMFQDDKLHLAGVLVDQIFKSLPRGLTNEAIDFGDRIRNEITEERTGGKLTRPCQLNWRNSAPESKNAMNKVIRHW